MRVVVLFSGRGTNLAALAENQQTFEIVGALTNRPQAHGINVAKAHEIPCVVVDHRQFSDREAFDRELSARIDALQPDLIVLAGFMRILSRWFVERYVGRMLNIHPSLLPKYRGLDTHNRALASSDTQHGATVHWVSNELDAGQSIAQVVIPILPDDTAQSLAERLLPLEHRLLVTTVNQLGDGTLQLPDDTKSSDHATKDILVYSADQLSATRTQ